MTIILLSGYACSGKDTCGQYMCEKYNFKRYAVADIMKEKVSEIFDIPMELLNTQQGKASVVYLPSTGETTTVRNAIIDFAMAKRAIDENYWIDAMITRIHKNGDDQNDLVVTDFRFPNEFSRLQEYFKGHKIMTVRILRKEYSSVDSKRSENVLDDYTFDHVIDNSGDMENLRSEVDLLMKTAHSL